MKTAVSQLQQRLWWADSRTGIPHWPLCWESFFHLCLLTCPLSWFALVVTWLLHLCFLSRSSLNSLTMEVLFSPFTSKDVKVLVTQLCLTLCDSMNCSLPGSSLHGILEARIVEWIAIHSSGIEPRSPSLQADSLLSEPSRDLLMYGFYHHIAFA